MKQFALVFFFLLFAQFTFAQKKIVISPYAHIDKRAMRIPDSLTNTTAGIAKYVKTGFLSDKDKVRAIYIWTAASINYDLVKMASKLPTEAEEAERIAITLQTRKGVCQDFAEVFTDICRKAGFQSYVISGYTKKQGKLSDLSHAWSATRINGDWFLFDPTWDSGFYYNGEFTKQLTDEYFLVAPEKMIQSHMPFDYLWQFLHYPVSATDFVNGNFTRPVSSAPAFIFQDSIRVYDALSTPAQLDAMCRRISEGGISNVLVSDEMQIVWANAAIESFNFAVHRYNEFINYHNQQFKPSMPDTELMSMITAASTGLQRAKVYSNLVGGTSGTYSAPGFQKSIDLLSYNVNACDEWLSDYMKKGKFGRALMVSLFSFKPLGSKFK